MEQLKMSSEQAADTAEHRAFQFAKPKLESIIDSWYLPASALTAELTEGSPKLSVKLYSNVICRYKLSGKLRYIEIPIESREYVSMGVKPSVIKSDKDFIRLPLTTTEDAERYTHTLCCVLICLIQSIPKDFSCCSRYEQCSNAKKCIHPDRELAKGCYYKKVLKNGSIFYGDNKTI
ncbi:MAG: hypothetical protein RR365_14765 [Bacteroides sp.]